MCQQFPLHSIAVARRRSKTWTMDSKIWTAEEFLGLTPAEQDALFQASIITDLDQAPAALVVRARARLQRRIAEQESTPR